MRFFKRNPERWICSCRKIDVGHIVWFEPFFEQFWGGQTSIGKWHNRRHCRFAGCAMIWVIQVGWAIEKLRVTCYNSIWANLADHTSNLKSQIYRIHKTAIWLAEECVRSHTELYTAARCSSRRISSTTRGSISEGRTQAESPE